MYFSVFVVSLIAMLLSFNGNFYRKIANLLGIYVYVCISIMFCLRYGFGIDYFSYRGIYYSMKSWSDFDINAHVEPIWQILCLLFGYLFNFEIFVAILILFEMYCLHKFLKRYSSNFAMSIFICLPVLFITYFCNIMRQGLSIAIFLCYGTYYIEKNFWKKYFLLCVFLYNIHVTSVVCFVVPFVLKFSLKQILFMIPFFAVLGNFLWQTDFALRLPYMAYLSGGYIMSMLERTFSLIVILVVYCSLQENYYFDVFKGGGG